MINLLNQVKAYFYVRPSLAKNKRGTFYVRVTVDGRQIVSSVKSLELYENEFCAKTQNPKPNCDLYMEVNDFMIGVKRELYRIHNDYQKKRMIFTKEDLRTAVHEVYHRLKHGHQQDSLTFLDIFDLFLKDQEKKVGKLISQGTYDLRISYQVKLKTALITLKMQSLPILNFGQKECERLQSHLLSSDHNKNYVARVMTVVNMIFKYAKKGNYIYDNPYQDVEHIKIDKAPNVFWLEQGEIKKMIELNLSGQSERIRDAFIFCCYTGLSIGDYELMNIRKSKAEIERSKSPKDIQPGKIVMVGNKMVLTGRRRKTGTLYRVPLQEEAISIINKYGSVEKLPFSLYGNGGVLNLLAKSVGVTQTIRFHTARKSFANYLINVKRVNTYFVKDIMGWIKIEEAAPYTRVSNDTLIAELI